MTDPAPHRLRDHDLARARSLLEPSRHVDGVAHHTGLRAVPDRPRHDQPAVDPDPELEGRGHLFGPSLDHLEHGDRRLHGPDGIVLVRHGHPEDGHHRVADEFLHRPLAGLDAGGELGEGPGHEGSEVLGIELLRDRGEPDEVGEEDRHATTLARHAHRARLGDGRVDGAPARAAESEPRRNVRSAETAEPEALGVVEPALGALHDPMKARAPSHWLEARAVR